MILVIVGRTGTGKTRLSALLEERGLIVAKTHATRPPRTPDEDSHYFISKEEADAFDPQQKAAVTVINGYEYFTAKSELNRCDIIVLDPSGITDLCRRNPDLTVHTVYLSADDMERKFNAVKRADDKIKEEMVFDSRDEAEDEQFSAFEEVLKDHKVAEVYPQCTCVMEYHNEFSESDMDQYADFLAYHVREHRRLTHIIDECMDLGIIRRDEKTGNPIVVMQDLSQKVVSLDYFADMINNDDTSALGALFRNYAGLSDRFKDCDTKVTKDA